ncbi:hypothetical protein ACQY0O_003576 [Thecaphora frezii]
MADPPRQLEIGSSIGQRPTSGFPINSGLSSAPGSTSFTPYSSPPSEHNEAHGSYNLASRLAAPRAMPPYAQPGSSRPADGAGPSSARSPSPSKRGFNFPMGDSNLSDRWNSIGPAASAQPFATNFPRKQSTQSAIGSGSAAVGIKSGSKAFGQEPFLGYNELLFSPTNAQPPSDSSNAAPHLKNVGPAQNGTGDRAVAPASVLSTSDPICADSSHAAASESRNPSLAPQQLDGDHFPASRFDNSGRSFVGSVREKPTFLGALNNAAPSRGMDEFHGRPFGLGPNLPNQISGSGHLSPGGMMAAHHQMQAPQGGSMAAAQHNIHLGINHTGSGGTGPVPAEEITTVFIVGFPEDMTEREFANMFLFARGFEASTLKVPAGTGPAGPSGRPSEGGGPMGGPGGPYTAVSMPGAGLFDLPNGPGAPWDDHHHGLSMALSRAGASDAFSSLANMNGMANALPGGPGAINPSVAGGKIKQIIGFAKFRTRAEALEARDALNGRKIDVEKGCVLKTEMAKKNLHTKQRPVLSGPGGPEGNHAGFMPPPGGPAPPLPTGVAQPPHMQHAQQSAPLHPHQQPPPPQPPLQGFGMGQFDRESMPFQRLRGEPHGLNGAASLLNGASGPAFAGFPTTKNSSAFEPFALQDGGAASGGQVQPNGLVSPRERFGPDPFPSGSTQANAMFGGGGQVLGSAGSEQPGRGPHAPGEAWSSSTGPLDYFGTSDAGVPPPLASQRASNSGGGQPNGRPDWVTFGSPPGLVNAGSNGGPRPNFARQPSRGPFTGTANEGGPLGQRVTGSQLQQHDDFAQGDPKVGSRQGSSPQQSGPDQREHGATTAAPQQQQQQQQQPPLQQQGPNVSRFSQVKLGSSPHENEQTNGAGHVQARANAAQIPSPDLPSPTGRGFVGDNHPPGNTLFVGNLPSSASNVVLVQIEDQLRSVFSSRRGFRQFSFRLKSNGPMCFVEFDDVHCASAAMSELNGNSLGGAIKNGGIRLSFSKNPLFRMNSNPSIHQQHQQHQQHPHPHQHPHPQPHPQHSQHQNLQHQNQHQSGTGPSSGGATNPASMSLGHAGESLVSATTH